MTDLDYIQLIHDYFELYATPNVHEILIADKDYLEVLNTEKKLYEQFQNSYLTPEQRDIVEQLIESICNKNSIYSTTIFRLGMQSCFSLIRQLGHHQKLP